MPLRPAAFPSFMLQLVEALFVFGRRTAAIVPLSKREPGRWTETNSADEAAAARSEQKYHLPDSSGSACSSLSYRRTFASRSSLARALTAPQLTPLPATQTIQARLSRRIAAYDGRTREGILCLGVRFGLTLWFQSTLRPVVEAARVTSGYDSRRRYRPRLKQNARTITSME